MRGEWLLVQAAYHQVLLLGTDRVTRSSTVVLGIRQCPSHSTAPGKLASFPSLPSFGMYQIWVFPENTFPGEIQSTQYSISAWTPPGSRD